MPALVSKDDLEHAEQKISNALQIVEMGPRDPRLAETASALGIAIRALRKYLKTRK